MKVKRDVGSQSSEGVGLAVTVGVRGWLSPAHLGYFHFVSLLGPQAWEQPHVHTLMLGISPKEAPQIRASRKYACSTTFSKPLSDSKALNFTIKVKSPSGYRVFPKCHLL